MTTKYHQISFNDIFSDCQNKLIDDSPSFFSMLSEHMDINEFIPPEFQSAFYLSIGRTRIYPLHGFLSAFILQKIFPFQQTHYFSCFSTSAKNYVISAVFPKSLMLL
jgi:hypothetical protein